MFNAINLPSRALNEAEIEIEIEKHLNALGTLTEEEYQEELDSLNDDQNTVPTDSRRSQVILDDQQVYRQIIEASQNRSKKLDSFKKDLLKFAEATTELIKKYAPSAIFKTTNLDELNKDSFQSPRDNFNFPVKSDKVVDYQQNIQKELERIKQEESLIKFISNNNNIKNINDGNHFIQMTRRLQDEADQMEREKQAKIMERLERLQKISDETSVSSRSEKVKITASEMVSREKESLGRTEKINKPIKQKPLKITRKDNNGESKNVERSRRENLMNNLNENRKKRQLLIDEIVKVESIALPVSTVQSVPAIPVVPEIFDKVASITKEVSPVVITRTIKRIKLTPDHTVEQSVIKKKRQVIIKDKALPFVITENSSNKTKTVNDYLSFLQQKWKNSVASKDIVDYSDIEFDKRISSLSIDFNDILLLDMSSENLGKIDKFDINDANNLLTLLLNVNSIAKIEKLEEFRNLLELSLNDNKLTEITGITKLSNLYFLSAELNQISSLSGIQSCNNLRHLSLKKNKITNIDQLNECKNIQYLNINSNAIETTVPLQNLKRLNVLDLGNNQIKTVANVEQNRLLYSLILYGNLLNEVPVLNNNVLLRNLTLNNNSIDEVKMDNWTPLLETLYIHGNKSSSICSLLSGVMLRELDVSFNQYQDIKLLKFVAPLKKLQIFNYTDNIITKEIDKLPIIMLLPSIKEINHEFVLEKEKQKSIKKYMHKFSYYVHLIIRRIKMSPKLNIPTKRFLDINSVWKIYQQQERDLWYWYSYNYFCQLQKLEFDFLHFSHNQNSKAKYAQESHAQFAKHKEKIRYDQSCLRLLENHYHQQLNFNVSNYQQRFVNNNFYEKNYVNQYSIKCLQFIQIWWKYLVVSKINKKKDKAARKIQKSWFKYMRRKALRRHRILNYAATIIQSNWKGYYQRKKYQSIRTLCRYELEDNDEDFDYDGVDENLFDISDQLSVLELPFPSSFSVHVHDPEEEIEEFDLKDFILQQHFISDTDKSKFIQDIEPTHKNEMKTLSSISNIKNIQTNTSISPTPIDNQENTKSINVNNEVVVEPRQPKTSSDDSSWEFSNSNLLDVMKLKSQRDTFYNRKHQLRKQGLPSTTLQATPVQPPRTRFPF